MLGTIIVARLLQPEVFGIFGICVIFVAFANLLKEFGVSNYLINQDKLTTEQVSSAFTLSFLFSSTCAFVLFFSAEHIAYFYDEPKITFVVKLLSFNVFLSTFANIANTLQKKELNFKPELIASISGQIISYSVIITLALNNFEEKSLAFGALSATIIEICVFQLFRSPLLRYKFVFTHVSEIFHFAKFVGISTIAGQLSHNAIDLAVGKLYSMHIVGLVNRGATTASLFYRLVTDALNPVITPYIAKLRHEGNDVKGKVNFIVTSQLVISWPVFLIIAINAEIIISILFGEMWLEASNYLVLFCIGKVIASCTQVFEPILLGLGIVKSVMKVNVILAICRISAVLIGSFWGLDFMLVLICIVIPIFRTFLFYMLLKYEWKLEFSAFIQYYKLPFLLTVSAVLPFVYKGYAEQTSLLAFVVMCICSISLWCISIARTALMRQVISIIKNKN